MRFGETAQTLGIIFAALGVISEAFYYNLVLEPTIWLLLAVVAVLNGIIGHNHSIIGKHLLGIETKAKKE